MTTIAPLLIGIKGMRRTDTEMTAETEVGLARSQHLFHLFGSPATDRGLWKDICNTGLNILLSDLEHTVN